MGVRLGAADKLFITHLHSDHIVGIPDLWLTGWLETPFAQRKGAFQVFGPAGTRSMMENLEKAYEWDIRTRIADQKLSKENIAVSATDIKEGIVYERDGVKVTAFEDFVLLDTPQVTAMTEQEVVDLTHKSYSGPLVVGEDLMVFRVGRNGVSVKK